MGKISNEDTDKGIEDIDIIHNIFPGDSDLVENVRKSLSRFKSDLFEFVESIEQIEKIEKELSHIPELSRLIINRHVSDNYMSYLEPNQDDIDSVTYTKSMFQNHNEYIDAIDEFLDSFPLIENNKDILKALRKEIQEAYNRSQFEYSIRTIINKHKEYYDSLVSSEDQQIFSKRKNLDTLLRCIRSYMKNYRIFKDKLATLLKYNIICKTQEISVLGHKLYIENNIVVKKETLLDVINKYLKTESKVSDLENIEPRELFESQFKKQKPVVHDYHDFALKIYNDFESLNKSKYRILTKDGKKFEELSAGWKTSILLDLVLGYEEDSAPLIIDQPEDNLATDYINHGLINAIMKTKKNKQIILVSHNATIPMLGDAQNVIISQNDSKIVIRSNMLEGFLNEKSIVDYIAEITDGGKPSIKKRIKKYNLKQFREE